MKTFLVLLVMLMFSGASLAQENEWILKTEIDGMKVFYRQADGSKVREIKLETQIESSLSTIIAILRDVPAYSEWIYNCEVAERLPEATEEVNYYYSEVNFPWPLSNRDFIARSELTQDTNTRAIKIEVKGMPDMLPEKKKIVRVPEMEITWDIMPVGEDEVFISYHLYSDPGGSIPAWLVNMFIDQGPRQTLKKFREMLKKEKYQQAKFADILE